MAARIVALLIPLAITLPQLQASRPSAPAPQEPAAVEQPAADPEWSYETRHVANAAVSRVVLASPLHEVVRTLDIAVAESVPSADTVVAVAVPAHARKAPPKRAALKLARAASPVKLVSTANASGMATRHAKRAPFDAGCQAQAHCAPVVVAKVTPVTRRPL